MRKIQVKISWSANINSEQQAQSGPWRRNSVLPPGYHGKSRIDFSTFKRSFEGNIKQNLGLTRATANHAVRMETGWNKTETQIFKKMLSMWYEILVMDPQHTQRNIFNKRIFLEEQDKKKPKLWTSQVAEILRKIDMDELWEKQSPELISEKWESILNKLSEISTTADLTRIQNSTSSSHRRLRYSKTPEDYLYFRAQGKYGHNCTYPPRYFCSLWKSESYDRNSTQAVTVNCVTSGPKTPSNTSSSSAHLRSEPEEDTYTNHQ